jgi:hypothetical protein
VPAILLANVNFIIEGEDTTSPAESMFYAEVNVKRHIHVLLTMFLLGYLQ